MGHHAFTLGSLEVFICILFIQVSYASIQTVERKPYGVQGFPIIVSTRALQLFKMNFQNDTDASKVYNELQSMMNIGMHALNSLI